MSKYVYDFWVCTKYVGSEVSDEIDLVDDYGYDEEYLDNLADGDLRDLVYREVEEWMNSEVEWGAKRLG